MRYYYKDEKYFYIGFRYDEELVKQVKKFHGASYNLENKEWSIPVYLPILGLLKKWLLDNNFKEGIHYTPSKRVLEYEIPPVIIEPETVIAACKEICLKRLPRDYQCEGIAYMINHGNCINGDDCGLGKTGQSICLVELMDIFPTLIITPASVKYGWQKEWLKWNPNRKVGVVDTKKYDSSVWENDVVIINYDNLGKKNKDRVVFKYNELQKKYWKGCIIDEIHFLKSAKALRTRLVKKLTSKIDLIWGLTGTLTQNKPIELIEPFKIIRRFDEIFGSTKEFKYRYCNAKLTPFGMDCSGFSNLEELHELMGMGGYIRRNKRDVLKELPAISTQTVEATLCNYKEYKRAENDLLNYLETIDLNKANNAVNAPHLVMLQTLKKLSVDGKIPFIITYIKEWLEANENENLIVFGLHREPLQKLAEHFKAPIIQGGTSALQKQKIVDFFCAGNIRILFANIFSAGTGVDGLQEKCSNLIYIELPDRYADIEQTNARLERMGQKNSINVVNILSPDTIDVEMYDMVMDKKMITQVVNNGMSEEQLLINKFLKK